MAPTTALTTAEAIGEVWRHEAARLVGALTRMTRDLDLAEDLAQDALTHALEQWPRVGIPANPGAWLMTTAKRRAIDGYRRSATLRRKTEELIHVEGSEDGMLDLSELVDFIDDDALRLIFIACHPRLTPDSRAALTLRLVGGLTTAEIARGFFVTESSMGQRISRAKRTLNGAQASFDLPTGADRTARLDDVLAVIYLIFNEGHTATSGEDLMRPAFTQEAIRLAGLLAALVPDEPEVHGLQALLELQASRGAARVDAHGLPILLEEQDRARWDHLLIRRGLSALERAEALARNGAPVGTYYLQAAIAACHARAPSPQLTDWLAIARLYDVLAQAAPGPVVEVNRAVAHGRAHGPAAGLAVLDGLPETALGDSHLLPSVQGDLLARAERHLEAAACFRRAASLTGNDSERALLQRRAEEAEAAAG